MDTLHKLINTGFDPKEAKIYLAILEFGPIAISQVAKKAEVKRSTIYYHIDDLVNKGFVQKVIKGKRVLYIAQKPQRIISSLEEKKKQIELVLPDLNSLYQSSPKQPKVKYYEGKDGLRSAYEEIFNTSGVIYAMYSPGDYFKNFSIEEDEYFLNLLKKSGGKIYNLIKNDEAGRNYVKNIFPKQIGRSKLLPEDFDFSTDILTTGSKTSMISLNNLTAVMIDNKEIADTQRILLKSLW